MTVPERRAEGAASPERIRLAKFSPALAIKFARGEITSSHPTQESTPIPDIVHENVIAAFTKKQKEERSAHWRGMGLSFGEQMQEWVNGESGIVTWMQRQQDSDVKKFIAQLLPEPTEEMMFTYKQELAPLLSVINEHGWKMSFEQLSGEQITALHLYARFFTGDEKGVIQAVTELVKKAEETAKEDYGDTTFDGARKILEKITPLMGMFGEKAQVAFAAITDAQLRLQYPQEVQQLNALNDDTELQLTPDDERVLSFLQPQHLPEIVSVEPDEDEKQVLPPAPSAAIESSDED